MIVLEHWYNRFYPNILLFVVIGFKAFMAGVAQVVVFWTPSRIICLCTYCRQTCCPLSQSDWIRFRQTAKWLSWRNRVGFDVNGIGAIRSPNVVILHSVQTCETYHWNNFHVLFSSPTPLKICNVRFLLSCPTPLKICNVWFSEVH
jgi:hypothetical protein